MSTSVRMATLELITGFTGTVASYTVSNTSSSDNGNLVVFYSSSDCNPNNEIAASNTDLCVGGDFASFKVVVINDCCLNSAVSPPYLGLTDTSNIDRTSCHKIYQRRERQAPLPTDAMSAKSVRRALCRRRYLRSPISPSHIVPVLWTMAMSSGVRCRGALRGWNWIKKGDISGYDGWDPFG